MALYTFHVYVMIHVTGTNSESSWFDNVFYSFISFYRQKYKNFSSFLPSVLFHFSTHWNRTIRLLLTFFKETCISLYMLCSIEKSWNIVMWSFSHIAHPFYDFCPVLPYFWRNLHVNLKWNWSFSSHHFKKPLRSVEYIQMLKHSPF